MRAGLPRAALRGAVPLPVLRRQLLRHVRLLQQRHVLARDRALRLQAWASGTLLLDGQV